MQKKLMIIGEVLGDVFPEQTLIGGAPYNVARHCHALGCDVTLVSAVGKDALGQRILREMQSVDLSLAGMQTIHDLPTGQVKVTFNGKQHQFEIQDAQAYDQLDRSAILAILKQSPPNIVYIGSLAMRHSSMQATISACLKASAATVFCDINLRAPWYSAESIACALQAADILKINHEELIDVARLCKLPASPDLNQVARQLLAKYALSEIFVTCAEQGSFWLDAYGGGLRVPPMQLQVPFVDSVGAGDAYSAVLLRGLCLGWSRQTMLTRAAWFATAMCGIRGAVPQAPDFYEAFL